MRVMKSVALATSLLLVGWASEGLATPSQPISGSAQGGTQSVPIDVDSDSCFTLGVGGPVVCIDSANSATGASGRQKIGPGADEGGGGSTFLLSGVNETTFVSGTGCAINPANVKSCTLNGHTDACAFTYEGGTFVNNYPDGSLLFGTIAAGGTGCIDFNAPTFALPFPTAFTINSTFAGGTGKYAGATGSSTTTGVGAVLIDDAAGHTVGWFSDSFTGTINLPHPQKH